MLRVRRSLRHLALAGALGALATGAACSSEDLADRVAEGIAERATDEDVDFDIDSESGQVNVSTPDGDFSLGSDELPEGFPSEVPLPEGLSIVTSMRMGESDTTAFTIVGQVDRSAAEVADEITGAFDADGWDETMLTTSSFGDTDSTAASYTKATWTVNVSITGGSDGGADVSYSVSNEA